MEPLVKRSRNAVYASNWLQHGRLHHERLFEYDTGPQVFVQQQPHIYCITRHACTRAGAWKSEKARTGRTFVEEIRRKVAIGSQKLDDALFVRGCHFLVERTTFDRFRQQLGDMTARVIDRLRLLLTSTCNSTPNSRQ